MNNWSLTGRVEFATAEKLAEALKIQAHTKKVQVSLKEARGGSALLLVLLAWQRRCLSLGAQLSLVDASFELQKIAELSHLENLLPLVFNTKEPS
ncbi:STAS domain-containing protein [Marinospirillum insulare]|uniref:STAS domain-containing protein n=1 Tax=Marinospirillum insulare TaxID=217169 RepID=UPI0013621CD1|nr:STAS domain-containing protein [Marinospirillum insulare]